MNSNQFDPNTKKIEGLERKIVTALWIQLLGQIMEAKYTSDLFALQNGAKGEKKISFGQWVGVVGQGLEAIGATKELVSTDRDIILSAQRIAINGNLLQSLGSALEAVGSEEVLIDELVTGIQEFIP
ncbi:DUF6944 family repetitive protein [Alkalihalobacillus sp. MEB130]|uniref:DUF6944 family repetitive protein n=1 Tax=Alkalihalobacillus sp. MEB130 TaxID=2976704 RepID=UPI0037C18BB9